MVGAVSTAPTALVESFCDALWQWRREWDVLDLVSVADESPLHRDLPESFRRRGCDVRVTPYTKCAVAELPGSFDEFLGKLGQGTRGEFRRKRRKLLKDVPSARFSRVEDAAELQHVFGEMVRLHQARWTRLGQSGSFASPLFEAFHRAASLEMLRRGWVNTARKPVNESAVTTPRATSSPSASSTCTRNKPLACTISMKNEAIKEAITDRLHRGVTVYRGSGGIGSRGETDTERDILYCVVTRLEIGNIKTVVREIDPNAFITTHSLSDVEGGLIKKNILH